MMQPAVPEPEPIAASAEELALRIEAFCVGDEIDLGASWLESSPPDEGELSVPFEATPTLLMYRNKLQPWPGFFVTGYRDRNEVIVRARDVGFDASRVFLFFNALMTALGATRFMPSATTYAGHALYHVRYLL